VNRTTPSAELLIHVKCTTPNAELMIHVTCTAQHLMQYCWYMLRAKHNS